MVKLYYSETSCGAANFLTARLAKVQLEAEQIDLKTHTIEDGTDFYTINPRGNCPTLILDDGTILNENAATLQYIADSDPNHTLIPAWGTKERYEVINALSYVGTEYHKTVANFFNPTLSPDVRSYFNSVLSQKLDYINDKLLKRNSFLVGDQLSVADIYLYVCLSWCEPLNIDLSGYKNVKRFFERMSNMPDIKEGHEIMATKPKFTI